MPCQKPLPKTLFCAILSEENKTWRPERRCPLKAKYLFVSFFFLTAILQWVGVHGGLYQAIWEYDSFMHFIGGISAGSFGIWVAQLRNVEKKYFLFFAVVFSFSIGCLWELKQIYIQHYSFPVSDTVTDIIMDTLGGVAVAIYITKRKKTSVVFKTN